MSDIYIVENGNVTKYKGSDILADLYYNNVTMPSAHQLKHDNISVTIDENKSNVTNRIMNGTNVPLYDTMNINIHLINVNDVYSKVVYEYYRFPELPMLIEKRNKLKTKIAKISNYDKPLKLRNLHKLDLMINFMSLFDNELLKKYYLMKFYYSNPIGSNITQCMRKSFVPQYKHIKPFYDKEEIIKLAFNMKLLLKSELVSIYDTLELNKLCKKVKQNDISHNILALHNEHIMRNDCKNLIQYFTLHGSYFMNEYLRNLTSHNFINKILEENIVVIDKVIKSAPAFDKEYTLYRFIKDDTPIAKMKIGDVHVANAIMSTTRDPFYNPDTLKFGFILIKIKIPKNIVGVALAIETLSIFPSEQELIIGAKGKYRLDAKNSNVEYYTLDKYQSMISTLYEMTFMGYVDEPLFADRMPIKLEHFDFLEIPKIKAYTTHEKINNFVTSYVNEIGQFSHSIGDDDYTIIAEWYNSTGIYRNYYAAKSSNGFCLYSIKNRQILFMIEIGESEKPYIYVNYYMRFTSNCQKIIDQSDFLKFVAKLGYYFDVTNIILYSDYSYCNDIYDSNCHEKNKQNKQNKYIMGNYCVDFYDYLKSGIRKYHNINEIIPAFSYHQLDIIKQQNINTIITKDKKDDMLYQLFKTIYSKDNEKKHKLGDYYVWIIENYCHLNDDFVKKMNDMFTTATNPFNNDYYVFNCMEYLYNFGIINNFDAFDTKVRHFNKNRNRIQSDVSRESS